MLMSHHWTTESRPFFPHHQRAFARIEEEERGPGDVCEGPGFESRAFYATSDLGAGGCRVCCAFGK